MRAFIPGAAFLGRMPADCPGNDEPGVFAVRGRVPKIQTFLHETRLSICR
jgi:hypothetical protein